MIPHDSIEAFAFGAFRAEYKTGELLKSGRKLKLEVKPFNLLLLLLERNGRIVSREEIRQRLWAADTFVQFDDGLNSAMKKLRGALGDSPSHPLYIETVPKRGYRFIAPVEVIRKVAASRAAIEQDSQQEPIVAAAVPRSPRTRNFALVVLAFAFVAIVPITVRMMAKDTGPRKIKSIAVLPLENLSKDDDQQFFADGMMDELITDLAKIQSIRVVSRTSMMRYKDVHRSVAQIADEMKVDAVVEGTISASQDRIFIRAQLIGTNPEQHVWAESYERPRRDAVALESEIARGIANAIRIKLTPEENLTFAKRQQVDPEAHELYLKGRYFWNRRTDEGYHKAREEFEAAIRKDPTYAAAYAGLADTFSFLGSEMSLDESLSRARENAERALQLDPNLAEAHASLALLARHPNWDWQQTKEHFERAIALNPNYATAHQWYGEIYFASRGDLNQAVAELRNAESLDPLSPIIVADHGKMLFYARRYDEAMREFDKALELDHDLPIAHLFRSFTYMQLGKSQEAFQELEYIKDRYPLQGYTAARAYLHACSGRADLAKAELESLTKSSDRLIDPAWIAQAYAAAGDKDKAFQYLELAVNARTGAVIALKVNPAWDPLRNDPRMDDLLKRMRL